MLGFLKRWVSSPAPPESSGPLLSMSLGPDTNTQNPTMIQFFTWNGHRPDMSWWQHLAAEAPRLAELGITQIWTPPANKALSENGQGYDAYDLWDLGEFDQKGTVATRWGTKDEFLHAVATAKQYGIDVLLDAVLNHKLGADRTEVFNVVPSNPQNRIQDIGPVREIEGWTAFDFPGRAGKYSAMRWTHKHFSGLDWDNRTKAQGVFRIVGRGRKGWSKNVDKELGNYDYLLGVDIDHRHPEVRQDLFQWASWVLETTSASGFRLDAIKHIDSKFLLEWIRRARKSSSERSNSFAVAEYWSANIRLVHNYVRLFQREVAFFDVPLHQHFHDVSRVGSKYDLRGILKNTLVSSYPNDAVTFVDNHDTQTGQSLQSWVDTNFKLQAYALILLRGQGHPCVFYGDLYPNEECYDEATAQGLASLMRARKEYAFGSLKDLFLHQNCIGFVRAGTADKPGCVVVLSNAPADTPREHCTIPADVGQRWAGARFTGLLAQGKSINVPASGVADFFCAPGKLEVWVPEPST
ncbi:glycoside hydrolase family 13 protein [Peniophora sp. CONT]|nr:glycoside hydrolase family 13 protein [Peniophora sp. CONT]